MTIKNIKDRITLKTLIQKDHLTGISIFNISTGYRKKRNKHFLSIGEKHFMDLIHLTNRQKKIYVEIGVQDNHWENNHCVCNF